MVDALAAGDAAAVYGTVDRVVEAGHDPRRFSVDLLDRFRDLILLGAVPDAGERGLIDVPQDQLTHMADQSARLGGATLTRFAEIVHTALIEMRGTTSPRLVLELLCARMLLPGRDHGRRRAAPAHRADGAPADGVRCASPSRRPSRPRRRPPRRRPPKAAKRRRQPAKRASERPRAEAPRPAGAGQAPTAEQPAG